MEYDLSLEIGEHPEVYAPDEDSELLIRSFDVERGEKVLEVGCGSGVVALHCALNGACVTAVDINPYAVRLAQSNFKANGLTADVFLSDVYEKVEGTYDTVLFNLPYLPTEEEGLLEKAWSGGSDGLGPLPRLLEGAGEHVLPDGRIIIVVSSLMDGERLEETLSRHPVKVLGELPLFFEKLRVLEIRGPF